MGHWKHVSEGARLEKNIFWPVLTCFWPVYLQFDAFFALSKKSGRECPKKIFFAKIWFVTCKTWYKSQKIHPLWVKNPAEIQETSFGQGRFFFQDIFALYETTRVHQCKIMSPGDHQLMLSSNTQGWQKRVGRMGICPPSFWQNRRCLWGVAALLLLAYTKQLEFISVIISPGDHQLIC